jgi:hypothetical protein
MGLTISKVPFTDADLSKVDQRLLPFIHSWLVKEIYHNKQVIIPDYVVFNYFEAVNKPEGIAEDEKQLAIWCGWAGRSNGKDIDGLYDAEVIITLAINGADATSGKLCPIHAEILKSGGASMEVLFNGSLVTDFQDKILWFKTTNGYQTIPDMRKFIVSK